MSKTTGVIMLILSALVILLSILFNIGNSHYIDNHLLTPAAVIFGASLISLSIHDSKPMK